MPFSVWLFVSAVPRLPVHNFICIMDKGGRPCGKSAATLKREREAEEKANPETRQRRMEDESFRRMNFFAGHTRATVSAGADTVKTPRDMQEPRAPALGIGIPADHSRRHCEIVVLSGGRWDAKLEHMPAYTHKAYTSGGQLQEPFPLMPGTQWHRSFQGRHAAVVHKERVTILFEIQMSVANLEQPLFVARDFHEGLFCKRLSATSAGALEKAWLSQNRIDGDPEISLSNMKGSPMVPRSMVPRWAENS